MEKATKKLMQAVQVLCIDHFFFGQLVARVPVSVNPAVETAHTNGRYIELNPNLVMESSVAIIVGIIIHKIMHIALGHHLRRKGRDPRLWNIAGDYEINILIEKYGRENASGRKITLPEWVLMDFKYEDWKAERIYNELQKEAEENKEEEQEENAPSPTSDDSEDNNQQKENEQDESTEENGQESNDGHSEESDGGVSEEGDPAGEDESEEQDSGSGDADGGEETAEDDEGAGSGEGGDEGEASGPVGSGSQSDDDKKSEGADPSDMSGSDFGGTGSFSDAPEHEDGSAMTDIERRREIEDWQVVLENARQQSELCGFGAGSGISEKVAGERRSDTDWITVLMQYLQKVTADASDWSRPKKQYISQGVYLPSRRADSLVGVVFVIDNSGSIDKKQLECDCADMSAILMQFAGLRVKVLYCDNRVVEGEEYTAMDLPLDLDVPRGGGTDFRPPFEWVEENMPDCKLMIYWTDMCCSRFPEEPDYDVIWANTYVPREAPFGEVVQVKGW